VVGSGAAGVMTAHGLRRRGFTGRIALIGDEPAHTYDRPPLSKQVLTGEWPASKARLLPAERLDGLEVEFAAARAEALEPAARSVITADGGRHAYDALVIATGVRPRRLSWSTEDCHVLRTLADAEGLRAAMRPGTRLAIVGCGLLGLEVAASARRLGLAVTVIETLETPLADRLGAPRAKRHLGLHRDRGVEFRLGATVEAREPGLLRLADRSEVAADEVLIAIGCEPNVDWLDGTGLADADGVACDEFCRAAPGIWAAGDVARWHHPSLGRGIRVEHRMNAAEQAAGVAADILGEGEPYAPILFFWTDHHEVKIQAWGVIPPQVEPELAEGDLDGESFVVTFAEPTDRRLVAAVGWNSARAMSAYRAEIAATRR